MEKRLKYHCSYCGSYVHYNKGTWTDEEDMRLIAAVNFFGENEWRYKPRAAGIQRCGLNCRNHWFCQVRQYVIDPDGITPEEEDYLMELHRVFGNNWPAIADLMPGNRDSKWARHRYLAAVARKKIMLGVMRVLQAPDLVQAQYPQDLNMELRLRPPSPPRGPSALHLHSF